MVDPMAQHVQSEQVSKEAAQAAAQADYEGQQEPVAWGEFYGGKIVAVSLHKNHHYTVPLYTHPSEQADYFGELVARARQSATKASAKFPQPNYVTLKIAEEAGEVVRGAVHYAEGRMEWSEVEGEIVQLIAMLIRFVTEGDQINGITPPARAALEAKLAVLETKLAALSAEKDAELAEAASALWRIPPNVHTIPCEANGFAEPDPFEGVGETYADAYMREKARAESASALLSARIEECAVLKDQLAVKDVVLTKAVQEIERLKNLVGDPEGTAAHAEGGKEDA